MFLFDQQPICYTDPWQETLTERLHSLYSRERRAAYFYSRPDNSTFRYRVYNMLESMRYGHDSHGGTYFAAADIGHLHRVLNDIDVLILCRSQYTGAINELICHARSLGVRTIFDIDDLVFDTDFVHLVVDTLDQNNDSHEMWVTWFADFARLGATMRMCDSALTTNSYLAERIGHYAGIPVGIVPNFLNDRQVSISEAIYAQKTANGFRRSDSIHIGYFSGTPTHNRDFDLVSDTIASLMREDVRLVLRIVGFLDLRGPIREFESRIEFVPFVDFVNLQRLIGEVEINIVPLQNNIFTNCKSELKYFEAGIVGTVSIASPTHTLSNAIADGRNGFLARSWEWRGKIKAVIDAIDREQYQRLAAEAYFHTKANYLPEGQADRIRAVLFSENENSGSASNAVMQSLHEG